MDPSAWPSNAAIAAALLLLLTMLWIRRRTGASPRQRAEDRLDTVQAWPAQLVSALTPLQRQAHELLQPALPGHLILVQTPLAQFIRVSTRHSYAEWHRRAGRLRASFLVCDDKGGVVAAVDLRGSKETDREKARHLRVVRVLESVGVRVLVWSEDGLPTPSQVRQQFASLVAAPARPVVVAEPEFPEPERQMSDAWDAMAMECTDFAGFDAAPARLK